MIANFLSWLRFRGALWWHDRYEEMIEKCMKLKAENERLMKELDAMRK